MATDRDPGRRGAYGLALVDVPEATDLLVAAPESWTTWRLRHRAPEDSDGASAQTLSPDWAWFQLPFGGWMEMDRPQSTTTLVLPERPADHALVHPYLASTASVYARWQGWNAFHAGGVAVDGGAWGIIGDRGAGKSSSLTWLALSSDASVLSDDVLVVDSDGHALAGPRCIDLRGDAARHFGVGEELGMVGSRERWRVRLDDTAPRTPFRGWVELAWADEVSLEPIPPTELLPCIVRNQSLRFMPPDAEQLMDLVTLPAWRLSRPPGIDRIDEAANLLVRALAGSD